MDADINVDTKLNITEQTLNNLSILDKYDFSYILNQCEGYQLEWFKMKAESLYPELEEVFDKISNNELAIYLTSKYKTNFNAVVTYYIDNIKNQV